MSAPVVDFVLRLPAGTSSAGMTDPADIHRYVADCSHLATHVVMTKDQYVMLMRWMTQFRGMPEGKNITALHGLKIIIAP